MRSILLRIKSVLVKSRQVSTSKGHRWPSLGRSPTQGWAPARSKPKSPKEVVVPEDLAEALRRNPQARAAFDNFSPSHKREYVAWITEARTQATRTRRLETAIQWISEGKPRNWKYMNC
jgi:hypothetical protein